MYVRKSYSRLYAELLSRSKFNLMIRGDDSCSSRFWDAISMNVINIVISDEFAGFHYCLSSYNGFKIPWNEMFLWISEKEFEKNPRFALSSLLSKYTTQHFIDMLQLIDLYKKYILWDITDSQVAYTILQNTVELCNLNPIIS